MVTSNKQPDSKVVTMAEHNNSVVVPQRTLLGEVNEHITCPLCRGYYIDATTIVECLHSFCRSCIIKHLQVKSYCPVCEMMINSAKPNIKLDKALQDIVYKLVPGLFQKEMERRQQFYSSRPGPAASATPEQRGEDTERVIFSPEDVISFSLEYADGTDADSISSKSSDSNDPQPVPATTTTTRRFLQCPAVVNISHLKKFLSMKFDIDSTQFAIDILYKRVPLPDYYTLMDIAYIYNWKRNEPMRFFYQIIDYIAIRNRLFDVNRKGSHFRDRKSSPASTEDTNVSSPTLHLNDQGSEASSGTDSPMLDESDAKQIDSSKLSEKSTLQNQDTQEKNCTSPKNLDEEVEKSQFLNSFELTPKSNCVSVKSSPTKGNVSEETVSSNDATKTSTIASKDEDKADDTLKRKYQLPNNAPELKKLRIELEKAKVPYTATKTPGVGISSQKQDSKLENLPAKTRVSEGLVKSPSVQPSVPIITPPSILPLPSKDNKQQGNPSKQQLTDNPGTKRTAACPQNVSSKRKTSEVASTLPPPPVVAKTVSPLKLQMPKPETPSMTCKLLETPKPTVKKMPDLKPSTPTTQIPQNKPLPQTKLRMDLLANNSDPTIDRSKILSQVKTSLSPQTTVQTSGDPLKSLFDSCKINIPSSLSITLTDQKLDARNPTDATVDPKKYVLNKNLASSSNGSSHKVPTPPVHNYIEILKLPDNDPKKLPKPSQDAGASENKTNPQSKTETPPTQSKPNKSSETPSAKGPVPNLKPIADTKLAKQSGNFSAPITFQQTFEQQVQSMQCDKKSKLPKNKAQVPKLMPASPKSFPGKPNGSINKPSASPIQPMENKTGAALDLSTPHSIQNQLDQQQSFDKVFETMQSIANLAKKQNLPTKGLPLNMTPSNVFPGNRPMTTGASPLRIPSTSNINQIKLDKVASNVSQLNNNRQELVKTNQGKPMNTSSSSGPSAGYQIASHPPPNATQPSPRSQTRSPSSSPKLVIAEDKQAGNAMSDQSMNQSNQITSTQLSNLTPKSVSPKAVPGPSRPGLKPVKPMPPVGKITSIRQPITPTLKAGPLPNPADYLTRPQLMAHQHHALLRHQMEMNAWIKAQRQDLMKNISNMAHQTQNDFNNKDKQ